MTSNATDRVTRTQDPLTAGQAHRPASRRWLTPEESRLLHALAALIVPSDDLGPGAHDADVVDRLDGLIAESTERQALYRSGLRSVQRLAARMLQQPLEDALPAAQRAVLEVLEQAYRRRHAGGTALHHRCRRLLWHWHYARLGALEAVTLFRQLVKDVQDLFYSSPVAWAWLGYRGPGGSTSLYRCGTSEVPRG